VNPCISKLDDRACEATAHIVHRSVRRRWPCGFSVAPGLADASVECRLRVAVKLSDIWTVEGPNSKVGTGVNLARNYLGTLISRLQKTTNPVRHSVNVLPSKSASEINSNLADVVNLHWVGGKRFP